ncbi:MAG: primosomal protein N' [Pirellulales bacterium]
MPDQPTLFETDIPAWELDESSARCVATVVITSGPPQAFDYIVPNDLRDEIRTGCRVRVPFGRGNREATGYCVGLETREGLTRRLKNVSSVVDRQPILSPSMLRLTKWMAEYYFSPWGQVIETVIPAGVRMAAGTRLATYLSVAPDVAAQVTELKLPKKQQAALAHLAAHGGSLTPSQLADIVGCTLAPVNALRRKGLVISESRREIVKPPELAVLSTDAQLELNADQQAALNSILAVLRRQMHEVILIQGVTGSGKTEVYMQAIQEVVSYGQQAIVLVPEISLTPQTESRFRSRFGNVAVLHSHMSDADRHRHWQQIASGEISVVVGARSAIFAPTPHLGIIIIDEEHETSFKQESTPRYHARDVAVRRAEEERVPLVLGSATPSLESFHRTQEGAFTLVKMPRRIFDRPLPTVVAIDLRGESHDRNWRGAISRQLHAAMDKALNDAGQVILLLNRRGFSTHIQCPSCGEAIRCPECEIALTHHKQGQRAVCHYCDYRRDVPERCPNCEFSGIRFSGRGTQRLEEEVCARFPEFTCLRMDTDSMQGRGSHEAALSRFRKGEVQILLGTQMIAKGLDFPDVTLVGVINADTALHLPDFRAAERTFQLVTQVAGRAGRGDRRGNVLVQTFQPDHPAIRAALRHDYEMFASGDLPQRQQLGYPPYGAMVRVVVRGAADFAVREFAGELGTRVRQAADRCAAKVRVLGPAPAPFAKLRGKYRFALQVQAGDAVSLHNVVRAAIEDLVTPDGIQWIVDIDPFDMM